MEASRADGPRYLNAAALIAIVAAAAALRFWGLRWGLPNELHDYSYHPDEFLIIGAGFATIYLRRTWNPGFYNYPSLYIYLSALAIAVALGYGASPSAATIYLCARVVTALMGTGAVAATWWAGRVMFGDAVGLLAALVICVAPLHVQHSHFATVDVPSTLFVALTLGFAGLVLKRGSWRDYVLAGAIAGLAAGTKYNAGLVLLAVIAAHFLREGVNRRSIVSGRAWATVGCAVAGFVVSTPGSVFATGQFLHGITYEMRHAAEGHGLVFAGTGNGFVYTFLSSLWWGLGPGLAVLFLAAVGWALWRRDRPTLLILAFVIPYYALISISSVRFARYSLPLFPAAAVLIGWFVWEAAALANAGGMVRRFAWCVLVAMFGLALVQATASTISLTAAMKGPDPRDQAARWVFAHVPRGATIGTIDWPWFYSPPLSKDLGFGTLEQRKEVARQGPYYLAPLRGGRLPNWVIVTDHETADAERLKEEPSLSGSQRAQVEHVLGDLRLIRRHYVRRVGFGASVDAEGLPHDMRYPFPTITIHERRK